MIVEEVAAMAVTFLLLLVLVQVATAMTAKSAADAAVGAAARQASLPGVDLDHIASNLLLAIQSVVPGAEDIEASVWVTSHESIASAAFRWTPPGPVLSPLRIRTRSNVPRVHEP